MNVLNILQLVINLPRGHYFISRRSTWHRYGQRRSLVCPWTVSSRMSWCWHGLWMCATIRFASWVDRFAFQLAVQLLTVTVDGSDGIVHRLRQPRRTDVLKHGDIALVTSVGHQATSCVCCRQHVFPTTSSCFDYNTPSVFPSLQSASLPWIAVSPDSFSVVGRSVRVRIAMSRCTGYVPMPSLRVFLQSSNASSGSFRTSRAFLKSVLQVFTAFSDFPFD